MASIKLSKQFNTIPSLLDRLTENSGAQVSEATIARGEQPELDIKAGILRDLGWLLNSTALATTTDLSRWPHVQRSVLNFGVGTFAGRLVGNADAPQLEMEIKKRIAHYEPRLRRDTLSISVSTEGDDHDSRQIRVRIDGEYVAHGHSMPISMDLHVDTETGRTEIIE